MSKQSQAKQDQGYRKKPDTCSNCMHFQCDTIEKSYTGWSGDVETWTKDKSLRCSVGNFAVAKNSTCRIHVLKKGDTA